MWVQIRFHPLPSRPPPLHFQVGDDQPSAPPPRLEWRLVRRTPVPSEDRFGIQQRPHDTTKYDPLPCPPRCTNPASKKVKPQTNASANPGKAEKDEDAGQGWEARNVWEAGEAWIADEVWGAGVYGHEDDSGMKGSCSAGRANGSYTESEVKCIYGHRETYEEWKAHLKHEAKHRRREALRNYRPR